MKFLMIMLVAATFAGFSARSMAEDKCIMENGEVSKNLPTTIQPAKDANGNVITPSAETKIQPTG
jgi:hypothetical protein